MKSSLPISRLEDLEEREHEDDDDAEVDDFSDLDDEPTPSKFWSTHELAAPPIVPITNNNNNDTADPAPKATFQRTIKNMLSSILNWRSASKNLPKGSREYYATRESLGEEMGTFRKQTMPRLIERAASKGRLDRSRGETSRRNLREFSNFIGKPKGHLDDTIAWKPKPSIATIHPVYGTLKSAKRPISRIQEINKPVASVDDKEIVYGSMKVQVCTIFRPLIYL